MSSIGQRVRQARVARKVTQAQLAKLLGVQQSMLSMLEGGDANAGPMLIGKLEAWLRSGGSSGLAPRGPYKK